MNKVFGTGKKYPLFDETGLYYGKYTKSEAEYIFGNDLLWDGKRILAFGEKANFMRKNPERMTIKKSGDNFSVWTVDDYYCRPIFEAQIPAIQRVDFHEQDPICFWVKKNCDDIPTLVSYTPQKRKRKSKSFSKIVEEAKNVSLHKLKLKYVPECNIDDNSSRSLSPHLHVLAFDARAFKEAKECSEPLSFLPYHETVVIAEGNLNFFGAIARETNSGIEFDAFEREEDVQIARNLLAFVEHYCSAAIDEAGEDVWLYSSRKQQSEARQLSINTSEQSFCSLSESKPHIITAKSKDNDIGSISKPQARGDCLPSSRRAHMRRAHIRRQHYGKNNSLVKTVLVRETLVGAHASESTVVKLHYVKLASS